MLIAKIDNRMNCVLGMKKRHSPVLMAFGCGIQVKSITLRLLESNGIIICNSLSYRILLMRFHVLRRA